MRITGIVVAGFAATLLATAALAQSMGGGSMQSGSMQGGSMQSGGGMQGGGMSSNDGKMAAPRKLNAQGGFGIFSREDMAMMIVDREKATKGMTADQAKAARAEEMSKDSAETPADRMARKQRYDQEWAQLSPAEQQTALGKYHAQLVSLGVEDTGGK
jgi:hypothetical protein